MAYLGQGTAGTLLVGAGTTSPAFTSSANANFTFGGANDGATRTLSITNTSDVGSSSAKLQITTGGALGEDPFITHTITGATSWSSGIDNSAVGDPFVLSASSTLGTTNVMSITTAGELTYPLQPAFYAFLSTTDSNATGDGTIFTVGSGNVYTIVADRGSDFVNTGTFTAPVTGLYFFVAQVSFSGGSTAVTQQTLRFVTTSTTYELDQNFTWNGNANIISNSIFAPMTANDTCILRCSCAGTTKTVDIDGVNGLTYFGGHLVC